MPEPGPYHLLATSSLTEAQIFDLDAKKQAARKQFTRYQQRIFDRTEKIGDASDADSPVAEQGFIEEPADALGIVVAHFSADRALLALASED